MLTPALASLAAVALAAGDRPRASSETEAVPVDQTGSVKAKCPRGTRAVSGGFASEFSDPPVNYPFIEIEASGPTGRRAWTSSGLNDGVVAGDLTSFAYCGAKELVRVNDTVPAPVGQFATASAKCPRGTKVISGGFKASPQVTGGGDTPVLYVSESRRAGKRRWEASAHSNGNEAGAITATASCGKGATPKAQSASTTVSDTQPNTPFDRIVARCKRSQEVISGGFGSPDASGEATPRFMASKRTGRRGWKVSAFYGSNGMPSEITAYAYCKR